MSRNCANPRATLEENWIKFHRDVLPYMAKDTEAYKQCRTVFMAGQISLIYQFIGLGQLGDDEVPKILDRLEEEAKREAHLAMFGQPECNNPNCPACTHVRKMRDKLSQGGGRG